MTPLILLLIGIAAASLAAILVAALRSRLTSPEPLLLTFDTAASRAREAWATFWAADPFVAAQRKRKGNAFATYDVPGSGTIAVHLAPQDLAEHTLILGNTGSGKSSLLESLALYRLRTGRPFALIDLHGDLYARVAAHAAALNAENVIRIDFTKPDSLPAFNPLAPMPGVDIGRQVDLLVGTLKRLYAGEEAASWAWGVKVEELMRVALRACIEARQNAGVVFSFADLPQFFLLSSVRLGIVKHASATTKAYFTKRYGKREEMYVSAVLNKLEPFLGSVAIQRFLGRSDSTVDLFGAMDRGETILINLAKGYLGPTADVMGRLLVNVLQTAALRREALRPETRKPYALLLDEAHVLAGAGSGLEDFLVAARKYNVFVTLAAQGLSLFPASFRPHLLGNTGRQFFFRMPYREARALAGDIFEAQGNVFRERTRPNEKMEEPLLNTAEEIAWRTRDLANLPVGTCYWLLKSRPYKARRIQVSRPIQPPRAKHFAREVVRTDAVEDEASRLGEAARSAVKMRMSVAPRRAPSLLTCRVTHPSE
jgi:hypothetical protein